VEIAGHAFIQNLRRGHYELAVDVHPTLRVAAAFTQLAQAIQQAARLVRREPVDLFPLVEEATTDFLAEDADGGLVFAHDLVRQAVYGQLTRGWREHLHREFATITRDGTGGALGGGRHHAPGAD
jgi:hypothetical protein